MAKKQLVRFSVSTPVEFDSESRTISGKIPYGTLGQDTGGFRSRLIPGCFANSLGNDILALFNHDWNKRLARTSKGSLVLSDESDGLKITLTPASTSWGLDCLAAIEGDLMDGFSFGGYILSDNWTKEDEERVEEILEFDLLEISPVFDPVFLAGAELVVNSFDRTPPEDKSVVEPKHNLNLYRAKQKQAEALRRTAL